MRNVKILAAAGLMTMAGIAQADVTGTAAIVTDYDFRGITQTGNDAALQGSIDYSRAGGWYAGLWGSSIGDFVDYDGVGVAQTELDWYTGFKGMAGDVGWDAGIVYYTYPGASNLNYFEVYGKATYSVLTGAVYYSNDFAGFDTIDDQLAAFGIKSGDAFYVSADAAIPAGPLTVGLHAGFSSGDGIEPIFSGVEDSYQDYSVGVSYSASNFTLGMKWVAIDAGDAGSDDRVILSLSTALPWK